MAGEPVIVRDPVITLVSDPDTTPVLEDISCYVRTFAHEQDVSELDVSTFCAPSATDTGRVSDAGVLTCFWSPDMFTALKAHIGDVVLIEILHNSGDTLVQQFRGRYAAVPMGTTEPGEAIEVDIAFAILETPDYVTATVAG